MSASVPKLRTFRVDELEAITGIKAWRWYELFRRGEGPIHFRVGRTIRVTAQALEDWLRQEEAKEEQKQAERAAAGRAG
jgi:predicted DNA-binding transcriptional regulator AlpA